MSALEDHIRDQLQSTVGLPYDEHGFSERIHRRHGSDLRWCERRRSWYVWDGKQWHMDEWHRAAAWAIDTANALIDEEKYFRERGEDKNANRVQRVRTIWRGRNKVGNALQLLKSLPGMSITFDAFDADPYLLNTPSGIIDLQTGELSDHRRDAYCTKITGSDYDPDADQEPLRRLLRAICQQDSEFMNYLQRAIGYSLIGDNPLELLFFIYGPTASGKSTLIEAVKTAIGDYAATANFKSFLDHGQNNQSRAGLARLAGARIVNCSETARASKFAEEILKWISGRETIVDHEIYEKNIEFLPSFTLFLVGNDRPRINSDDAATWRRLRVLPFTNTVPEYQRDQHLKTQLTTASGFARVPSPTGPRNLPAGAPGVLAWIVEGCRQYQQHGLGTSQTVLDATEDYRTVNDELGGFIAECCHVGEGLEASTGELRRAYEAYCAGEELRPIGVKAFAAQLEEKGYSKRIVKRRGKAVRMWFGLSLVESVEASSYGGYASDPMSSKNRQKRAERERGGVDRSAGVTDAESEAKPANNQDLDGYADGVTERDHRDHDATGDASAPSWLDEPYEPPF